MREYYNAMRLGWPLNHLYQTVIEGKVPFLPALLVVQVGKPRRCGWTWKWNVNISRHILKYNLSSRLPPSDSK